MADTNINNIIKLTETNGNSIMQTADKDGDGLMKTAGSMVVIGIFVDYISFRS